MRSHIIPKFFWKPIKEADGFYIGTSTNPEKNEYQGQKEHAEHLLCKNCDCVKLQQYEDYLSRVLFQKAEPIEDYGRHAQLNGLDYLKTKKALLSILWRMSHSKQSFFKHVNLGSRHSEKIRTLLYSSEYNIAESEYPIAIIAPYMEGQHIDKLILEPTMVRLPNGNRAYRCFICGFFFAFEVGSASPSKAAIHCNLKTDGTWIIGKREVHEIEHLWKILCKAYGNRQ